jgi:hypothetical protein
MNVEIGTEAAHSQKTNTEIGFSLQCMVKPIEPYDMDNPGLMFFYVRVYTFESTNAGFSSFPVREGLS